MPLLDVLTQSCCTYLYWDTLLFETTPPTCCIFWILKISTSIWDLNTDVYAVLGFSFPPITWTLCCNCSSNLITAPCKMIAQKKKTLHMRCLQTACVKLHVTDTHPLTLLYRFSHTFLLLAAKLKNSHPSLSSGEINSSRWSESQWSMQKDCDLNDCHRRHGCCYLSIIYTPALTLSVSVTALKPSSSHEPNKSDFFFFIIIICMQCWKEVFYNNVRSAFWRCRFMTPLSNIDCLNLQ